MLIENEPLDTNKKNRKNKGGELPEEEVTRKFEKCRNLKGSDAENCGTSFYGIILYQVVSLYEYRLKIVHQIPPNKGKHPRNTQTYVLHTHNTTYLYIENKAYRLDAMCPPGYHHSGSISRLPLVDLSTLRMLDTNLSHYIYNIYI